MSNALLTLEDLAPFVEYAGPHRTLPSAGNQMLLRFPNGYGASLIQGELFFDPSRENEVELAVIVWTGDDYHVTYTTPVTSDVERGSPQYIRALLYQIKALPPQENKLHE